MDTAHAQRAATTAALRLRHASTRRVAVAVVGTLLLNWVSLTSFTVTPQIPELWFPAAAGFFCLTSAWDLSRRAPYDVLALVSLAVFVTFAVQAVLTGQPVLTAARLSTGNLLQSLLLVVLYRRFVSGTWAPRHGRHLIGLLCAATVAAASVLLIGSAPGVSVWTSPPEVWGWWVLRNLATCFVGGCLSVLFDRRPDLSALRRKPHLVLGLSLASVACLAIAFSDPTQPLSWVMLVPAVWAGMALRLWGAAFASLMIGFGAAALALLPGNQFGYGHSLLPPACQMDLLVAVAAFIALLLAMYREQSAELTVQVTQQREAAQEQAHMFATIFQSLNDGIVILDDRGRITRYNPAAAKLLSSDAATLFARDWVGRIGLHRLDGSVIEATALGALRQGILPATRRVLVRNDRTPCGGTTLEVSSTAVDVYGEGQTLLSFHDVTGDQHHLNELKEFARTVAHDLRGPLSGVLGWMELSQETAAGLATAERQPQAGRQQAQAAEVVTTLDRALHAGRRLDEVIEGWLGYTVTRSGAMRTVQTKVAEVAEEVARSLTRPEMDKGTLQSNPVITVVADDVVRADPTLLRQVLANLVGNSLKYARPGTRPRVTIASVRTEDSVAISVCDNGMGIPLGSEQRVFEEGWRADHSRATHRGNGLGLALCRQIVERHGGDIRATRNHRGGTTITFTLPAGD